MPKAVEGEGGDLLGPTQHAGGQDSSSTQRPALSCSTKIDAEYKENNNYPGEYADGSPKKDLQAPGSPTGQVDEGAVLRKVNWRLLPLLWGVFMLDSTEKSNLAYAAGQLNRDLGFSKQVYGFGAGAISLGGAAFKIPAAYIIPAVGAKNFLTVSVVTWGIIAAACSMMRTKWEFFILRFVLGIAESGTTEALYYHLGLFYSSSEVAFAYSVVTSASSISGIVGGPVAAGLLSFEGLAGLHGWQWLFIIESIPAFAVCVMLKFWLAEAPSSATFLDPGERSWLQRRQDGAEARARQLSAPRTLGYLRNWRTWWLGIVTFMYDLGQKGLQHWAPLIIAAILQGSLGGQNETPDKGDAAADSAARAASVRAALLSSIPYAAAVMGLTLVAWHSKRTGERHWHSALPTAVAAISLGLLPILMQHQAPVAGFLALTVTFAGVFGMHGPFMTWPSTFLSARDAIGAFAVTKLFGSLASFSGSALIGSLTHASGDYGPAMTLLAIILLLAAVLMLAFREPGQPRGVPSLTAALRMRPVGASPLPMHPGHHTGGEDSPRADAESPGGTPLWSQNGTSSNRCLDFSTGQKSPVGKRLADRRSRSPGPRQVELQTVAVDPPA